MTYEVLLEQLWDCDGQFVDKHTLAVNINRLRRNWRIQSINIFQMCMGWDINGLDNGNRWYCCSSFCWCDGRRFVESKKVKQEADLFAKPIEEAIGQILSGKELKETEEVTDKDTLWGKCGENSGGCIKCGIGKETDALRERGK